MGTQVEVTLEQALEQYRTAVATVREARVEYGRLASLLNQAASCVSDAEDKLRESRDQLLRAAS